MCTLNNINDVKELISALNMVTPLLGVVGSTLVFLFGIPGKIGTGAYSACKTEDGAASKKLATYKWKILGNVGIMLIIASFLSQFLVSVIKSQEYWL